MLELIDNFGNLFLNIKYMGVENDGPKFPEKRPDDWIYGHTRKQLEEMGPKKTAVAIMRGEQHQGRTHAVIADVFSHLSEEEIAAATHYGVDVYMGRIEEEK